MKFLSAYNYDYENVGILIWLLRGGGELPAVQSHI